VADTNTDNLLHFDTRFVSQAYIHLLLAIPFHAIPTFIPLHHQCLSAALHIHARITALQCLSGRHSISVSPLCTIHSGRREKETATELASPPWRGEGTADDTTG